MSVLFFGIDSIGELLRMEAEALAAAGLARAERWRQGIAARARLASEEIAAASSDLAELAEVAVLLPFGIAVYMVDAEYGVPNDVHNLLRRVAASVQRC